MAGVRRGNGRKKRDVGNLIVGMYVVLSVIGLVWLAFFLFSREPMPLERAAPTGGAAKPSPPRDGASEGTRETIPGIAARPAVRGKLVLVIDDAGYDSVALERFLAFPGPLAVSVLPDLPGSADAAKRVLRAGKSLMLHLPMEPEGTQNPGPGAVFTAQKNDEIRKTVERHVTSLPGILGVNNHMGSKATRDERVMRAVIEVLKERSLFFLDSLTNGESVGKKVAAESNLPFLERSVFLDNEKDKTEIRGAFEKAKVVAEKRGYAVMIGHVWCSELADVLMEIYPEILDEGFRFYPVSDLLTGGNSDDDPRD